MPSLYPALPAPVGWTIVNDAPIGIFDSGVGGLTVARAVSQLLPRESVLYIGDTAHSPYGPKPIADVRRYSLEVLDTLVDRASRCS
jgi:glutamate racemase